MIGWTFANAHDWVPDLPLDPPVSDFEKHEARFDQWLSDNYDKETDTVFGVPNDEAWDDETLLMAPDRARAGNSIGRVADF